MRNFFFFLFLWFGTSKRWKHYFSPAHYEKNDLYLALVGHAVNNRAHLGDVHTNNPLYRDELTLIRPENLSFSVRSLLIT